MTIIKAIRAQRVDIDIQKPTSVQWVTVDTHLVEYDELGKITSLGDRDGKIHRRVDVVATEIQSFTDPVTGQRIDISVAGIGIAISQAVTRWIIENNPGSTYDPALKRVLLNDSGK